MIFSPSDIWGLKSMSSLRALKGFPITSKLPPLAMWQATFTKVSKVGKEEACSLGNEIDTTLSGVILVHIRCTTPLLADIK